LQKKKKQRKVEIFFSLDFSLKKEKKENDSMTQKKQVAAGPVWRRFPLAG